MDLVKILRIAGLLLFIAVVACSRSEQETFADSQTGAGAEQGENESPLPESEPEPEVKPQEQGLDPLEDLIKQSSSEAPEEMKMKDGALDQLAEQIKKEQLERVDSAEPGEEEVKEYPPFIEMDPIEDYKFNLLIESLFSMEPLDFPQSSDSGKEGIPWQEFEKSDTFQIVGDLFEIIVRFEYAGELSAESNKLPAYHLAIRFEEDRPIAERMAIDPNANKDTLFRKGESVVIKHSHPKRKNEAGGVRIPMTMDRQRRLLLEGRDDSSVVVLIPQVRRSGTRGIVLCPRDYDIWKLKSGSRLLHITGHEMVGLEVDARATAKAGVNSGFGPGLARAVIQTTNNIQRGTFIYDESRIQYPYVEIDYVPLKTERRPLVSNKESITAGIRVETVHHNSLNHKTVSVGTVVMTIKKVDVQRKFPLTHKEINFQADRGVCFAILKETRFKQKFLKELLPQ